MRELLGPSSILEPAGDSRSYNSLEPHRATMASDKEASFPTRMPLERHEEELLQVPFPRLGSPRLG